MYTEGWNEHYNKKIPKVILWKNKTIIKLEMELQFSSI